MRVGEMRRRLKGIDGVIGAYNAEAEELRGEVDLCGCVHRSTPGEILRGSLCVHCEDKLSLWGRELEKGGADSADGQ